MPSASPLDYLFPSRKLCAQLLAEIVLLRTDLGRLAEQVSQSEIKQMSALTDLQAAVARLAASTSAEIKAVADKLSSLGNGGVSPDDVEAAVASLNQTADTLDAETASLLPSPAPGPTGGTP